MSAVAAGYAVLSVMQHENWVSLVFTKKGEAAPPKYCLWPKMYCVHCDKIYHREWMEKITILGPTSAPVIF